jgi:hypothetical protein
MANHMRQQVREAVATALTGLATTSTRVYENRLNPLQAANLPCLVVTTDSEQIEYGAFGGLSRRQHRNLRLVVKGIAKASASVDDTLDTICKEVEVAIAAGGTFGGKLGGGLQLESTQIELDGDGDKTVGVATMEFSGTYLTMEGVPDA